MDQKKTIQQALIHSLPIMGSYLFVSMAYGLMMQEPDLLGLVITCQYDGVYRRISVCTGYFSKQWCIHSYDHDDCTVHEQPTVLLWIDLCRGF